MSSVIRNVLADFPRLLGRGHLNDFFRTILLSVISLLNEPNTSSPANVDASVMYRKWKESGGKDDEYARIVRSVVLK